MMEEMFGVKQQKLTEYRIPDDNPQVFENLLQDIDRLYVGVNALFTQKGIYDLPIPSRKSEPRHNVNSGLFLEISQRHRVPFNIKTTAAATWKFMGLSVMLRGLKNVTEFDPRMNVHTHYIEQSSDTIKSSFLVEMTSQDDVKDCGIFIGEDLHDLVVERRATTCLIPLDSRQPCFSMLDDPETLESVFSFLAQIDLPSGLTALNDETHETVDGHDLLSVGISREDEVKLDALCHDNLDQEASALDLSASNSCPASSEASSPQRSDTSEIKPKRVRISKKQQIDTLREEVQELNQELQSLLPGPNTEQHPQRESMWRAIAERQQDRREKSEEENLKLRDMVQIQIHEARNLRRVLKRRTKIEMMEEMLGMKRQKILESSTRDDNAQVFEDMLQDTDALYVGVDALFAEKGIYDLPVPSKRSEPRHNVSCGLFLEASNRHRVPFDLRTTDKAMWKVMAQIVFQGLQIIQKFSSRVQFHTEHVEQSSDTIKTSFFVETAGFGDIKGARLRKVVRKYVESDRVVYICKNLMEPIMQIKGKRPGFHTRTTLRVVLRSSSVVPGSANTSVIDSHFTATRFNDGPVSSRVTHSSANTANMAIGVAAWDEAISRIAHQVESLAIDESFSKRGSLTG